MSRFPPQKSGLSTIYYVRSHGVSRVTIDLVCSGLDNGSCLLSTSQGTCMEVDMLSQVMDT
jgi:hypothetical protein